MNFKTAILSSAAAAFLIASPALAQEIAPAAPATQDAPAQPSLSLTPGTSVHGPDGELGKLEGVQNNASGAQELTVRGADGQLRAVPLLGDRPDVREPSGGRGGVLPAEKPVDRAPDQLRDAAAGPARQGEQRAMLAVLEQYLRSPHVISI